MKPAFVLELEELERYAERRGWPHYGQVGHHELLRLLRTEAEELNALFDLQFTRMAEATELWRRAHPGNDLVQPDLGHLLEWLMLEWADLR